MRLFLSLAAVALFSAASGAMAQAPPAPGGERSAFPPFHARPSATPTYRSGFQPWQIRRAYGLDALGTDGSGQTIAIVDAYGSPSMANDLTAFNRQFGLPAASLTIAYPQGKPSRTDAGWALETSMDVEWAHALAPNASILLVVAKTNSFSNLFAAVDYAVSRGARVVSMSWGANEFSSEAVYDSHFRVSGVVFTASSGDSGTGVLYPAASPSVVAVGGTSLQLDATGAVVSETAWSGSGGGVSAYEAVPAYQAAFGVPSAGRGVPDVAFDADPYTGVAVYDSTNYSGQKGWFVVGGTSLGAPCWAALVALANQSRTASLTDGHSALYQLAAGGTYAAYYRDIFSGSNGNCGPICGAQPGYDYVTGLGGPLSGALLPSLAVLN